MPLLPKTIIRKIADNSKLIHEYELQLKEYEGRTCKDPAATNRAIANLKIDQRDLRVKLDEARAAERRFMKKR